MLEKQIERQLVNSIKAKGGLCLNFNCLSMNSVPDRIVLMPYGKIAFVEVKAPGKKLRALQIKRKKQFEKLGFEVALLDYIIHIDGLIVRLEKNHEICTIYIYQKYGIDFLMKNKVSALLLDMGLGKTVISLTAIYDLMLDYFEMGKTLIIAPLRLSKSTWQSEIRK